MQSHNCSSKVDVISAPSSYCSLRNEMFKLYRVALMQNAQALRESNLVSHFV